MNNRRLLTGLFCIVLSSVVPCIYANTEKMITIEELFAIAESNSAQLRPAFTAEKVEEEGIRVAKSQLLPDIEANLSLSFIGDGFTTKRNFSDYQKAKIPHFGNAMGINVNQPLYTGGALTAGIEMAEIKSTASRYATDLKRDNIRFALTGFYLDIYKYFNLRSVVEKNLDQAKAMLNEMTARFEQGVALRNDITRYELLISNLELQLIKIDNTIDIFNNNLITTAGLPSDIKIIPDTTILNRSLPQSDENSWQMEASLHSPSLKLAQTGVEISRKAEKLVKSEKLPKVGLQAAWTFDGPILVEVPPIDRNLSYWYVGVGVSYNLASLYKSNKSLAKSRLAIREAEENLEAARQQTSMEIRADYVKYLEAYEELKTQRKSVELAERNYSITSTRYSADMALITDLLDAVNAKLDAEQQLVNARINIIYFYYKLLFTSGKI